MYEFSDLRLFKENDLYILFYALFFFAIIVKRHTSKINVVFIRKYFIYGFWLRIFFTVLFAGIIQYYYKAGDTIGYYKAMLDMRNAIADDPTNILEIFFKIKLNTNSALYSYFSYNNQGFWTHVYMQNVSNYFVPRFALPFSYIFFNSYLGISFCFTFFSFLGCWRLFKMFIYWYPHLHKKMAISFLFLPSVLFWGGAFMKDSICLGAIGFLLYGLFNIIILRRNVFFSLITVIFAGFLLYYIKIYILLTVIPALTIVVFLRFRKRVKERILRQVASFFFLILAISVGFIVLQEITKAEMAEQFSVDRILKTSKGIQEGFSLTEEGSGSNFSLGSASESFLGLFLLFPAGLAATLFRPFIWEVESPFMMFSALEGFGILILTFMIFRRIGVKRIFSIVGSDSVLVFCLVYSILFAGIVGITTTNFGALVRYKIPAIPFYLALLFIVMDRSGRFSPNVIFNKRLF